MDLKQIVQWMLENNYLVVIKGKYKVTSKFNKEVTGKEMGVMMLGQKPIVTENALTSLASTGPIDWTQQFLNFIKDAEVPARGEGKSGGYDINKYSEEGMKAFKKAIESGVQYPVLVKSTMLYYKTHSAYALKIGNYMADGAWRSDYEMLLTSAKEGTITEHIQQQLDENTDFNKFTLG